jgi:hypothetical protein
MDKFKMALEDCGLDDLGFVGDTFTWRNHSHTADNYIRERLDRVVATNSWRRRFPAYKVINSDPRHSDHRPIIVDTCGALCTRRTSDRNPGPHFEARWLEEEACKDIVENA